MSKDNVKSCENCGASIPEDFVNNLCETCYKKLEKAASVKYKDNIEKARAEEKKEESTVTKEAGEAFDLGETKKGISDPNYEEREQAVDKEQWATNVATFARSGVMLWKPTRQMYTFINKWNLDQITEHPQYPKFIWKPKIVDVGCGCGVGSNVLSQEADFVWGIDKNEKSVRFARECFERVKNKIYYSSQVTFDHVDIFDFPRETMKFDLVVAIEIIEHVEDYEGFLKTLINKFARKDKKGNYDTVNPTKFFISTPNRSNRHIADGKPGNKYHVREWTAPEMYNVLLEYFDNVEFHSATGVKIPYSDIKETIHTPILALAWNIKK